jgi:hypothetical protein
MIWGVIDSLLQSLTYFFHFMRRGTFIITLDVFGCLGKYHQARKVIIRMMRLHPELNPQPPYYYEIQIKMLLYNHATHIISH